MNSVKNTFKKSERLCNQKVIEKLFEHGDMFYTSLFRIIWIKSPYVIPYPAQVIISISKKNFRNAVIRNLIKRRIKEAYRKNKSTLYDHLNSVNTQIVFAIILKVKTVPEYTEIEKSIKEIINKFIQL